MNMQSNTERMIMQSVVNATMGASDVVEKTTTEKTTVTGGMYDRSVKRGYVGSELPKTVSAYDPRKSERMALQSEIDRFLAAGGKINKVGAGKAGLTTEEKKALNEALKPDRE